MNVASTTASTGQVSKSPTTKAGSTTASSSDFSTFLTLLTTQLKNQDPLKPLESTQFIAQLASFSAVEQQVKTNGALTQIQNLLGGSPAAGLASWIGLDVRVSSDPIFSGKPIDAYVKPAPTAEKADLVVTNDAGKIIDRVPLDMATDTISWSGHQLDGTLAPPGKYHFSVESFLGGKLIDAHQAPIYQRVREARIDTGSTLLVLSDGQKIPADQVSAMRDSSI